MQHIFHDPNGLNKYFGEETKRLSILVNIAHKYKIEENFFPSQNLVFFKSSIVSKHLLNRLGY